MSVYFPALIEALRAMATDRLTFENRKWYRAIEHKLNVLKISIPEQDDYLKVAQQLFQNPLVKIFPPGGVARCLLII